MAWGGPIGRMGAGAAVVVTTVVIGTTIVQPRLGDTPPGGDATANIWVDSTGGTCTDSASLVAYSDAAACATLDAANDTCEAGDLVYVKTGTTYGAQTISGNNGRTTATDCVIEAEPGTGRARSDGFFQIGADNTESSNPNHLTIRRIHCGDTTSYTNASALSIRDTDDLTIDDWACTTVDLLGATNTLVENSDFGKCGSNTSPFRLCVSRISMDTGGECCVTVEDSSFHDMWCGTGNTSECAANHTDGMAIFGGDQITLRRVKFYRNDITNIRLQSCCGNLALTNIVIEDSWFAAPCIDGASGSNCTGGFNGNAFDIDTGCANCIVRFNTFADQTAPQCTSGDCGTSGNNTVFTANIYSIIPAFCSYGFSSFNYNATSERGSSGTADCGTDRYGTYPSLVNASNTAEPPNFHLTGSAGNADDFVDNSFCSGRTDIDLASRGNPCDAGSDER
jgi:hypothetical protein